MKRLAIALVAIAAWGLLVQAQAPETSLREALARYDKAVGRQDVEMVKSLLAPDVLLYEHSVRNVGLQDVFENHLKPEILEFENLTLEFSAIRLTVSADLALVTRQYKLQGRFRGREIDASGNETMVWKKIGTEWRVAHIHYSHPCPKAPVR